MLHETKCSNYDENSEPVLLNQEQLPESDDLFHKITDIKSLENVESRVNHVFSAKLGSEDVIIKASNGGWGVDKLDNELNALRFISENTTIPVPEVLGSGNNLSLSDHHSSVGRNFLLLRKIDGIPWSSLPIDHTEHQSLVEQAGCILKELRQFKSNKIGSALDVIKDSAQAGTIYEISGKTHPACDDKTSYLEYLANSYLEKIYFKWPTQENRDLHGLSKTLQSKIENTLAYIKDYTTDSDNKFFLSHQDFNRKNILVNPDQGIITAVLDWEWCGFTLMEYEYNSGCDFMRNEQDREIFLKASGFSSEEAAPIGKFDSCVSLLYGLLTCDEWKLDKVANTARFLKDKLEQKHNRIEQIDPILIANNKCRLLEDLIDRFLVN